MTVLIRHMAGTIHNSGPRVKALHLPARSNLADDLSDSDRTRSLSPPTEPLYSPAAKNPPGMQINHLLNEDTPPARPTPSAAPKGPGRGNWSRNRGTPSASAGRTKPEQPAPTSNNTGSPHINSFNSRPTQSAPHGFYLPLNGAEPSHKRSRPATAHQKAIQSYRQERVNYILDRRLREEHKHARRRRLREGAVARAWKRLKTLPAGYDTDEGITAAIAADAPNPAAQTFGFAGLLPLQWEGEGGDRGEEASAMAQVVRKASRRLERWEGGVVPVKKKRKESTRNGDLVWVHTEGHEPESSPVREYDAGDEALDDEEREMLHEVDADETEDEMEED